MTINKLWILPSMAVVVGVFMLGWMIGSGRAPMQQSQGLDRPETQPITAAGNQAEIKRDGPAPAAVSVETPDDSIARQDSRQLPASGARFSLVGMERRLTSGATDDLEAIILATQIYRALPPPAASQTIKAASGVTARQHAATGLTDNPQDAMEAALDSTASPALRKPDKTASGTTAFSAPATDKASDEESTPPRPSLTTTNTATTMQHQEAVTEQPSAVTASNNKGPWVINLVSTPSKADADRMTGKALSRGIQTEQQEATVKGKQYWRVQITGFATAEDARHYSETVRKKLGLKAVWIKKR